MSPQVPPPVKRKTLRVGEHAEIRHPEGDVLYRVYVMGFEHGGRVVLGFEEPPALVKVKQSATPSRDRQESNSACLHAPCRPECKQGKGAS